MTYLELPLLVSRLKDVYFLPLEDKVAHKLAPWNGQLIAAPGRSVLVKAVLTALKYIFLSILRCFTYVIENNFSSQKMYW